VTAAPRPATAPPAAAGARTPQQGRWGRFLQPLAPAVGDIASPAFPTSFSARGEGASPAAAPVPGGRGARSPPGGAVPDPFPAHTRRPGLRARCAHTRPAPASLGKRGQPAARRTGASPEHRGGQTRSETGPRRSPAPPSRRAPRKQPLNLIFFSLFPPTSAAPQLTHEASLPRSALAFPFRDFKAAGNVPKGWSEQTLHPVFNESKQEGQVIAGCQRDGGRGRDRGDSVRGHASPGMRPAALEETASA